MRRKLERSARRGGALVPVLIVVAVVTALSASALTINVSTKREVQTARDTGRALYLAEAAVSEALHMLDTALHTGGEPASGIGSTTLPRHVRSGDYWADVRDEGDGRFTITAHGRVARASRALEVVVRRAEGGVFGNAIFAGNRSRDPGYALRLGGEGAQADLIDGRLYSGGDVDVWGDATVTDGISAAGAIHGAVGEAGASQPLPDIESMHYEVNHDFDVDALFAGADWVADDAGGSAWQVAEDNPAHIFRKNPSDRGTETSSTEKDDYFLEDPYEPVRIDAGSTGADAYPITLSGQAGNPGPDGSDRVYFIDGNLWIHNQPTFSFVFAHDPDESARVTFVVRGNIVFSDNVFYQDPARDGVAFIAIQDDAVADSGNIYFGDPRGGTLEHMDAFMYAENDFIDYHLDATGSRDVQLNGTMSAGNHVAIERDYEAGGTIAHSRLAVDFDERLLERTLDLPGIPGWTGSAGEYEVVLWREVAREAPGAP